MKTISAMSTVLIAASLALGSLPASAAQPTAVEVGDADSYGKKVIWIGLATTGTVILTSDCTPDPNNPLGPDDRCVLLNPTPALTSFNFPDLGRITLPGSSVNSLICHWSTPNIFYSFNNPGPAAMPMQFRARATYRLESEVLRDPSLIDPTTGLPFGGGIDVSISGVTDLQTVAPGASQTRQVTATRTCIAGLVSKAALTSTYGLSETRAKMFFQKPITIRVGASGTVRGVSDASLFYSTRFTGDDK